MTVIEIIVVSAVAVVVLTVLITLSNSSSKMNKAALSSVTLQSALLIQETIATDIRQLGVVPQRGPMPLIAERGLSFFKCAFDGKDIKFHPVRYGCERTPAGNYRLIRTQVRDGREDRMVLDGFLGAIKFSLVSDPVFGSVYLRVTMSIIDDDVPMPTSRTAFSARSTSHEVLCRIPIPTDLGNPRLRKTNTPVLERDLLPLN